MSNYTYVTEDPPPMGRYGDHGSSGGRPSKWSESLAAMKSRPGVWHRMVDTFSPATASYIANGRASGIAPGDYEATTRRELGDKVAPRGKAFLFVRYVGGEEYPQPEVEAEDDGRAVYQGLPCDEWRIGRNGVVEYHSTDLPRYGGGSGWRTWERAWERQDMPAPPEPAREDLPPGDERV